MANVYRADHIGTFIHTEPLLAAQAAFAAGRLDAAALQTVQDSAISELIEQQKAVVMTVVSDGGFRRADPDEPYRSALEGLKRVEAAGRSTLGGGYAVCGKLRQTSRLAQHEAAFLKAKVGSRFKICLLSPSALALRLYRPGITDAVYRTIGDLAMALGPILRSEVQALFQEDVPYVQLDSPSYDALFEGGAAQLLGVGSADASAWFEELLAIDAEAIKGISRPDSAALALHVERIPGLADAGDRYERMVARVLERLSVDRVLLEYGEPQSHDFTSLAALPEGRMAVLGLVRTAGAPEEIGAIMDRIDQAARVRPEDTLALSPRRGFANEPGRPVAEQLKAQQESLLRASEIVQQFWGLEL